MNSQIRWNSIELLNKGSNSYCSQTLIEMKKMYDMLKSYYGVWATTQDTVSTLNELQEYREYMEESRGRIVSIVINDADIPDGMKPRKKKI
ncbi:hypothetical protein [Maridesulfovibrio bastinii]|uniref:hypothetical protein n=1 Tax=Maridesulfovibrio bastinii TaxID=47157 RepID=UPI000481A845|nr:hypothetical protein [Maridesulfovibrio bastinii]